MKELILKKDSQLTIGRQSSSNVCIADQKASGEHAVILFDGKMAIINDIGSTNGTFVNGKKVVSAPLKDNDKIIIGETEIVYIEEKIFIDDSKIDVKIKLPVAVQKKQSQNKPQKSAANDVPSKKEKSNVGVQTLADFFRSNKKLCIIVSAVIGIVILSAALVLTLSSNGKLSDKVFKVNSKDKETVSVSDSKDDQNNQNNEADSDNMDKENSGGTNEFTPTDISENQEAKDVLSAILNDLVLINELVSDDEDEEEMSLEQTMALIDEYTKKVDTKVEEIKARTLNDTQLVYVQDSELTAFEMSKDMLLEFKQTIDYHNSMLDIFARFEDEIEKGQQGTVVDLYYALEEAFKNCAQDMEAVDVPTYMQFRHNRLIDSLDEYSQITSYAIISADSEDVLRLSNSDYFLNYCIRGLDAFSIELEEDVENRMTKFEEDIEYIDTWSKDLEHFISNTLNTNTLDLKLYDKDYLTQSQQVIVSYTLDSMNEVIPANYRSLDYLVFLQLWTNKDSTDVMVTVEIPDYTQKYQEKISVTRAETELVILPALVSGISEKLKTSKDAQVNITVNNIDTGEVILQESRPIKMFSIFDMRWASEEGTEYLENALAWVTPENDMILTLLRHAADSINVLTDGAMNSIPGYQGADEDDFQEQAAITFYQTAAIMNAMADTMEVKYIMAAFSSTDTNLQRVATPERVLENKGGLCIETAVTLASALKAANMNAMILLLPGHAQVAVETWYGSGEYFLIETTALDGFSNKTYDDDEIYYYDKAGWANYIEEYQVIAIDCDMAKVLSIYPID